MSKLPEIEVPARIQVASGEPPKGNPLFEKYFSPLRISTSPLPASYNEGDIQRELIGQEELATRLPMGSEQAKWMTRQLAASKVAAVVAEILYGPTDFNKLTQAAGTYFAAKDMTVYTHYHPDSLEGQIALGELQFKPKNPEEMAQMIASQARHGKVEVSMAIAIAGLGNDLRPRIVTAIETIFSTHPDDYLPRVQRFPIDVLVDEITTGYKSVCGGFLPSESELNSTLLRPRTVPKELQTILRGVPHIDMIQAGAALLHHEFADNGGRGSEASAQFTDQVYLWSQAASLPRLQMLSGDDKIMQDWQKMHQANNPYL